MTGTPELSAGKSGQTGPAGPPAQQPPAPADPGPGPMPCPGQEPEDRQHSVGAGRIPVRPGRLERKAIQPAVRVFRLPQELSGPGGREACHLGVGLAAEGLGCAAAGDEDRHDGEVDRRLDPGYTARLSPTAQRRAGAPT